MKVFARITLNLLNSSQFLEAQPSTVKEIIALNTANVAGEMCYVKALERYIAHHKDKDGNIEQKVRPALQSIRFLTLTPKDIVETSLLTAEEAKRIIICWSSDENMDRMPQGFFSGTQEKRHLATFVLLKFF